MAHFAQLDENNVVVQVIVVKNDEILDENGNESEAKGIAFCQSLCGTDTRWVQTSYNSNFRKRYATVGGTYDSVLDVFVNPKPISYPSFVLDPVSTDWVPPLPRPTDNVYYWDEATISWIVRPQPYPSWTMQGDPLDWVPPVPRPEEDPWNYVWDETTLSWVNVPNPVYIEPTNSEEAP